MFDKYNKPLSIIPNNVISKYRRLCNKGTDNIELAKLKINRINDIGKIVYRFSSDNEKYLVQYWNMVLVVDNYIVVDIYRDFYNKVNEIDYKRYDKWNKKHGITGERKW